MKWIQTLPKALDILSLSDIHHGSMAQMELKHMVKKWKCKCKISSQVNKTEQYDFDTRLVILTKIAFYLVTLSLTTHFHRRVFDIKHFKSIFKNKTQKINNFIYMKTNKY